jgi:hypothetical protein
MSFSCAHFDPANDGCLRLGTDCVPGLPGCVTRAGSVYLVPVEERIREKEESRRAAAAPAGSPPPRPHL